MLKIEKNYLLYLFIGLLASCGGSESKDEEEILAEISAEVEIVNSGNQNITYLSISILPFTEYGNYNNELEDDVISIGERRKFNLACLASDVSYIRVGWKDNSIEDYSLSAPCGYVYTVTFPQ